MTRDPFPANLAKARKQRGLTQNQLANKIGKREGDVGRWESGDNLPTFETARRLAQALDVPLDELVREAVGAAAKPPRRGKQPRR